ncbi:MAG: DNA methyltransferase [Hyphomicrobiales bacterium]|nr:DNA methyltransferase [Hyphomicrobiales bacterium]
MSMEAVIDTTSHSYPVKYGEFWTNKQRQGHSLNEISYRACFKPQLPQYFIDRYSKEGDIVLDPFMGRGTTLVQSALNGRIAYGSDINPLSEMLTSPRLSPPLLNSVTERFRQIPNNAKIGKEDEDLLVFYHPKTLRHLLSLKSWFIERDKSGDITGEDKWIRMVIANRLSGHSPGFLSVKTMPPNQSISVKQQRKINEKHGRAPEEKDVLDIVLRKSKSLLRSGSVPSLFSRKHKLRCCDATSLDYIKDGEVDLAITSPPFMNVVDYAQDNWLRCWFVGIDEKNIAFDDFHSSVESWKDFVRKAFKEFARVTRRGGYVAFEVGEVRNGSINLEEKVVEAIEGLSFVVEEVLVNVQEFTKTSNCWGVKNNEGGTNTNRIVVARRD